MSEEDDRNRWHNTFLFLRHTLYQTHGTYSKEEIANHLENKLPAIGASRDGQARAPVEDDNQRSQDNLVTAAIVG